MQHKSEAPQVVGQTIKALQLALDKSAKRFHNNYAKEL